MEHQVAQGRRVETAQEVIYPWLLTHQLRWNDDILEQRWRRERYAKDANGVETFVRSEFKWQAVPGKSAYALAGD